MTHSLNAAILSSVLVLFGTSVYGLKFIKVYIFVVLQMSEHWHWPSTYCLTPYCCSSCWHRFLAFANSGLLQGELFDIFSYRIIISCVYETNSEFSVNWWCWLIFTGVTMACCVSVKFVGLFQVMFIGLVTIADLWFILGNFSKPIVMSTLFLHTITVINVVRF